MKLETEEILDFADIFGSLSRQSYSWDLWAVAYIVGGGCSDDAFDYFRFWLIGQGQEYFEAALREPERAADKLEDDDCFWEELSYVAGKAYQRKTGVEIYEAQVQRQPPSVPGTEGKWPTPTGIQWKDEEELKARFPRLWEKFE